ncbi:unnamed protein product [Symbiodinium sp. CCMP2592]|nr:unnamed protein product [Symbiodinium sp. CCMP2592]
MEVEPAGRDTSPSPSSSCGSSPSPPMPGSRRVREDEMEMRLKGPIDAVDKAKKSVKTGFDLRKNPGEEKRTVFGFMERLKEAKPHKNTPQQLGIAYNTVEIQESRECFHQSTLTVTAEDKDGVPYVWSGREFRGPVVGKKTSAEHAAASVFLADSDVQRTAANLGPSYKQRHSHERMKQRMPVLIARRTAKRAAARQARENQQSGCWSSMNAVAHYECALAPGGTTRCVAASDTRTPLLRHPWLRLQA